jgi:hypothetical protein
MACGCVGRSPNQAVWPRTCQRRAVRRQEITTNRVVDSSFTAIITAPIDKIDIPIWMPPIVSTLMDIRVPSGGQLSLQSIMRKFELGLANENQRNLGRASQRTALRPFTRVPVEVSTLPAGQM